MPSKSSLTNRLVRARRLCEIAGRARDKANAAQDRAGASLNELLPVGTRVRVGHYGDGGTLIGRIARETYGSTPIICCISPEPGETVPGDVWQRSVAEKGYFSVCIENITILAEQQPANAHPCLPPPAIAAKRQPELIGAAG